MIFIPNIIEGKEWRRDITFLMTHYMTLFLHHVHIVLLFNILALKGTCSIGLQQCEKYHLNDEVWSEKFHSSEYKNTSFFR